jgi:hypothetical protein
MPGPGRNGHQGRTNPSVPRPRLPPTSAPERERHTGGASVLDPNSHTHKRFRGADEGVFAGCLREREGQR